MKTIKVKSSQFAAKVAEIMKKTPNYPAYAAEGAAADYFAAESTEHKVRFFGGDTIQGFTFHEVIPATPANVLKRLKASRFPVETDNCRYTLRDGKVYAQGASGNMSRSTWAKGDFLETLQGDKVIVVVE